MNAHAILSLAEWKEKADAHFLRINPHAESFLKRREIGKTHAVYDFLFTYYSFSPQKLRQWIPSIEQALVLDPDTRTQYPWLNDYWFIEEGNTLMLNRSRLHDGSRNLAKFVIELSENILERPPRFGCFGLHEWAMVYKMPEEELRHKNKLRMSQDKLAAFVESQNICCSHYDAYRFFTTDAKPLNVLNPQLETRLQLEQAGCVHANMDLYKWGLKLWPWIGSDYLSKAFFLALEGRELDMRASPYDIKQEGFQPICIETEEGRRQYQKEQQRLTEKSQLIRLELKTFCERLISLPS